MVGIGSKISNEKITVISGSTSLSSTAAVSLEFLEATYGSVFDIVFGMNLLSQRNNIFCQLYDESGPTWTDQDAVARDFTTGDVLLVPTAGAAVGDIVYFGIATNSKRLDINLAGGVVNSDNVFAWEKHDGSELEGLSDGTRDEEVVDACEAAWDEYVDADVTSTLDEVDYKVGSGSAKLEIAAAIGDGDIIATNNLSSADLSGLTYIDFWIKCSEAVGAGDLQILLDNSPQCATPLETLDIGAVAADTWTHIYLVLGDPSALTAIVSVGLKYTANSKANTIHLDDVITVTRELSQSGTVTWTNDLTEAAINGITKYWVRARVALNGSSLPIADHVQMSPVAEEGFDSLASLLSWLNVRVFRKIDGVYQDPGADEWPFQQLNLSENPEFNIPAFGDTKIEFELDESPDDTIVIPYEGYVKGVKS